MYNTKKISAASVMDSDIVWGIREGFFVKMEFQLQSEEWVGIKHNRGIRWKKKCILDKGKDKSEGPKVVWW